MNVQKPEEVVRFVFVLTLILDDVGSISPQVWVIMLV